MPENEPLSTAAEPEPEATEPQPEPEQEQEAEPKDDDALGRTSSSKPASAASLSQPSMAAATLPTSARVKAIF